MLSTLINALQRPIALFAKATAGKWSPLILSDTIQGVITLTGFHGNSGLAKNALTERLSHLVEHDILRKKRSRPCVNRHVYERTIKGKTLLAAANNMTKWSQTWVRRLSSQPHL